MLITINLLDYEQYAYKFTMTHVVLFSCIAIGFLQTKPFGNC